MSSYVICCIRSCMSQIIRSDITSKRGKEIEKHLNSISMEQWFSKMSQSKNMKKMESEINICPYCDQHLDRPYWEPRYSGIKAKCKDCNVIWNLT